MRKLHSRLLKLDSQLKERTTRLISLAKDIDARIREVEERDGSPQELAELQKARHDIEETLGKLRFEGITPDFAREKQPR